MRFTRLPVGAAAIIAAAAAAAAPGLPFNADDEEAARAWIRRDGHPFDVSSVSERDLAPLRERLRDAQVIGLGEATHGTHQDQSVKAELIKSLVRARAIDVLALECNRAAAVGFDHYVQDGVGDPVALIQSPSFFAIWQNDVFAGLLLWLRAWNRTAPHPVSVVGIDDQDSAVDATEALAFVGRFDQRRADAWRLRMASLFDGDHGQPRRLIDWAMQADATQYGRVQAAMTELRTALNDAPAAWRQEAAYADARYAAEVASQGLYIFELNYKGADPASADLAYLGRRDRLMADNLVTLVGDRRAVLWAHDMHVAAAVTTSTADAGYVPVGTVLRSRLGQAYRTVGFTWTRATVRAVALADSAPPPSAGERLYADIPLRNDRPGDFGHVFSPLSGNAWWVDLSARPHTPALDRWGQRELFHGFVGWNVDTATFQMDPNDDLPNPPDVGFDIMVWFREMSPAHAWPEPPRDR